MGSFLLCVVQYVLIMAVIAVIGFCGAKLGISLRKNKDAKTAVSAEKDNE